MDVVSGAVIGGLASVTFYGAGKGVKALKRSTSNEKGNLRAKGKYKVYQIPIYIIAKCTNNVQIDV